MKILCMEIKNISTRNFRYVRRNGFKENSIRFRNMMDKNVEKAAPRFQVTTSNSLVITLVLKKVKSLFYEPTSSLDKESKKDVIQFIKKFSKIRL